ncbi:recombination-associated protein RdgC [Megalodesulfovibrio paquesii]
MGFCSASASITRYRIVEEAPSSLWMEIPERLQRFAFKDIDQSAEERSFGWSNADNWLDTTWREGSPQKGDYFVFNLRLETRRVSPAVFKKHFELHLADAEHEARQKGQKFVGRNQKKELKEQVKLRLMARALPVPAVFEVAWNMQTGHVWLASTNSKVKEMFTNFFTDTFELHLEPLTPFFLGLSLLGQEAGPRLEALEPAAFV